MEASSFGVVEVVHDEKLELGPVGEIGGLIDMDSTVHHARSKSHHPGSLLRARGISTPPPAHLNHRDASEIGDQSHTE